MGCNYSAHAAMIAPGSCLGWDPERFDVFRRRVEYPVMHSVVSMQFDLPERM